MNNYKRANKNNNNFEFALIIQMIQFILVACLIIKITTTSIPCINTNPAGCILVDVNNTYYSYICKCLTCDANLTRASDQITCCALDVTRYCQTCNSTYDCTSCITQFGFNDTYDCVRCDSTLPNCYSCQKLSNGCIYCMYSYALNNSACVPCYLYMPYCGACSSTQTTCSSCNSSLYAVNSGTNPDKCQFCNRTLSNCHTCGSTTQCQSCDNNLYAILYIDYDNRYCQLCNYFMPGCYNCSGQSYCFSCINDAYSLNKNTHQCSQCSETMPNCITCNSSYYCTSCQDQKYALIFLLNLTYMQVCQICAALMMECLYCSSPTICSVCSQGIVTGNGCTKVVGCAQVNNTISILQNCISCNPLSFYITPVNGTCVCIEGWTIGQFCTTIIGCTGLAEKNNVKFCMNCNYSAHFILNQGNICECRGYYYLSDVTCLQICGDGHLINLPCDDGNLINGDGCSDQCTLEQEFICHNDKTMVPGSQCQFKGKVMLSLSGIFKVANKNQVQIIFNINPYNDVMMKMNFTQTVTFNSNGSNLTKSFISSQQLILVIDYSQNIQGNVAKILVQFDPMYVKSPNFKLEFNMVESTGLTLGYSDAIISDPEIYNFIMKILSFLFIAVFILGSVFYKMIGVQTIQTIQIILNLQASSSYFKSLFYNFDNLTFVYGQISTFLPSSQGIKDTLLTNLGYKSDINHNYLILGVANMLVIIVFFILKIVDHTYNQKLFQLKLERDSSEKKINQADLKKNLAVVQKYLARQQKLHEIQRKVYCWFLFPLLIGFYFQFFNSLFVNQTTTYANSKYYEILVMILILIATSYVFFRELITLFVKGEISSEPLLRNGRNWYVSMYLIYSLSMFELNQVVELGYLPNSYMIVFGIAFFQLALLIIYLPYNGVIHNISIIFNQIAVLFMAAWIIFKGQSFYDAHIEGELMYIFVGVVSMILVLALGRALFELKQFYFEKIRSKEGKTQAASKDEIIKRNDQLLVNVKDVIENDSDSMNQYKQRFFEKSFNQSIFLPINSQRNQKQRSEFKKHYRKLFKKNLQTHN